MVRKDFRTGVFNSSGTGKKDGESKRLEYQEGDCAYIVENHRTVRQVTILRRMGEFYTIGIGNGGITLRKSRLYATEEAAQKSIRTVVEVLKAPHKVSEDIGMRGYPSPYNYANSRSPYGI